MQSAPDKLLPRLDMLSSANRFFLALVQYIFPALALESVPNIMIQDSGKCERASVYIDLDTSAYLAEFSHFLLQDISHRH
jgi:hypothetical protein